MNKEFYLNHGERKYIYPDRVSDGEIGFGVLMRTTSGYELISFERPDEGVRDKLVQSMMKILQRSNDNQIQYTLFKESPLERITVADKREGSLCRYTFEPTTTESLRKLKEGLDAAVIDMLNG